MPGVVAPWNSPHSFVWAQRPMRKCLARGTSVATCSPTVSPTGRQAHTCLPVAAPRQLLQLQLLPAVQQGQLLRVPAIERVPQLGQCAVLLPLQVRLCQLQSRRVHVAQAQAQRLQLKGSRRLWGHVSWGDFPSRSAAACGLGCAANREQAGCAGRVPGT